MSGENTKVRARLYVLRPRYGYYVTRWHLAIEILHRTRLQVARDLLYGHRHDWTHQGLCLRRRWCGGSVGGVGVGVGVGGGTPSRQLRPSSGREHNLFIPVMMIPWGMKWHEEWVAWDLLYAQSHRHSWAYQGLWWLTHGPLGRGGGIQSALARRRIEPTTCRCTIHHANHQTTRTGPVLRSSESRPSRIRFQTVQSSRNNWRNILRSISLKKTWTLILTPF